MKDHRAIFSGAGGQGLMFVGKLLAQLALDHYRHITFFPSYGAEVRGGTSNCQVVFSDEPIATPMVEEADAEILMNQPSVDRFLPILAPGGLALVNSSMASAEGDNVVTVPATDIAFEIGDVLAANVVMFGAYLKRTPTIDRQEAMEGVLRVSRRKGDVAVQINRQAFEKGWGYAG